MLCGAIVATTLTALVDQAFRPAVLSAAENGELAPGSRRSSFPTSRSPRPTAVPALATGLITVAHCRVAGVIGTEITLLAAAAGRLESQVPDGRRRRVCRLGREPGAGDVVNAGYATAGTDTGHQAAAVTQAGWALNNLERQVNFGYLARASHGRSREGDRRAATTARTRRAPTSPAARTAGVRR